ncbi:MAG: TorF family putative porin [Flavobacterium sp.]
MKKEKLFLILLSGFLSASVFSQEKDTLVSVIREEKEKKLEFNLDVLSRYLWRGQCWGGNYIAVQPVIDYSVSSNLTLGFWATSNFQKEHFYPDGTEGKGYQEIDFGLTYQINDFLQFQVWDYYWPTVEKVEGVDNGYFNYGPDGTKSVDAILYFDFSEGYKFPFNATISTLVAGNDYRYDSNGENPKQNFTTYLELGYTLTLFENAASKAIQNIEILPVFGAVLNNKAEYYTYADYDKVSFVNMGVSVVKGFDLGKGISSSLSLNYTHNAATKNTEFFGKDFLVAGINFSF